MNWHLIEDYKKSDLATSLVGFLKDQETSCMDAASFLAAGKKGLRHLIAHTYKESVDAAIFITDYGRVMPVLQKNFDFYYKDVKELEELAGNSIYLSNSVAGRDSSVDMFLERFGCGQRRTTQEYYIMTLENENFREAACKDPKIKILQGKKKDILPLLPLQKEYEIQEVLLDPSWFELSESYLWLKRILSDEVCFYAKKGLRFVAKANTNEHGFDHVQIGGVFTTARYRNRGIAHAVVSTLCRHIVKTEKKTPSLFVKRENSTAIGIYSDIGFKITDSAKTVYLG